MNLVKGNYYYFTHAHPEEDDITILYGEYRRFDGDHLIIGRAKYVVGVAPRLLTKRDVVYYSKWELKYAAKTLETAMRNTFKMLFDTTSRPK